MACKVGDRVRYHHAGHVGWFATVAKVCGSEVWLRDYSNGYPDDDEESDQAWCATYDFLPAPRYEQCGCVCEGRTANRRRESRGDWCGAQHPPMPAYVALDALTAGLRALSAEGAKPAKDSGGSAGAATRKDESLRAERDAALAEVERLRGLLDRDRTGLAAALNAVRTLIRGWWWVGEGGCGWASYSWEDHTAATLRKEWSEFARQAQDVIERALRESGRRADAAFRPQLDARASEMKGDRGDAWCDRCLAAHEVGRLRAERDTAMDALREHDVTLDELRAVAFMNADADGVVVLCADGSVHRVPLERLAALKAMADAALKGGG